MLEQIKDLPDEVSKPRICTILDTIMLGWDNYSTQEKIEYLQVLANDKIHFQSDIFKEFTSNLLTIVKSKEVFETLILLNPGAISVLDNSEILVLLGEFKAVPLVLYLDLNEDSTLQWIESNILLIDLSELDILEFTRIWVVAAMNILKRGRISFFYSALQNSILGPLLSASVPTAAIQYMKSAELPESTIAVFESMLQKPDDALKNYSEFALEHCRSEPLIYLIDSLLLELVKEEIPAKIDQAVVLSKKYNDNVFSEVLQHKLSNYFSTSNNLQFNKTTLAVILKLPSPDLTLNIKAIMHAERDIGLLYIRDALIHRKTIDATTFLAAYTHFKGKNTELTFEFLKYALSFALRDLRWSRIVLFCTLDSLSDPYLQLFLTAKIKEDIKITAKFVNDDRANIVLQYL